MHSQETKERQTMEYGKQLTLFDVEQSPRRKKANNGGSQNPIVFHDYESFIAKFADNPKTTDDCYTPQDVYEAVVEYVGTVVDLTGKQILRPFFPGGDYENDEYPADGIVIDNPPFSIFTKICRFYAANGIPFFLFGPGLTIGSIFNCCTAVIAGANIVFANGASVRVNFASNLYGDLVAVTAPSLLQAIERCPSQNQKVNLPKYAYPAELVSVSDLQTICNGGISFAIRRGECVTVKKLANHPKKGLFGEHLLASHATGAAKEAAKEAAKNVIPVTLSERELEIVKALEARPAGGQP